MKTFNTLIPVLFISLELALFSSLLIAPAFGQDNIYIVTPSWKDQTNRDGTGLFFDIVRRVYEPVGIKMKYEILPWRKAEFMVNTNQADATLCVFKDDMSDMMICPKYPMVMEYISALFKKNKIEWKGIESFKDKNIIWLVGYYFHMYDQFESLELKLRQKWDVVYSHDIAWRMLRNGRADAFFDSYVDTKYFIKMNNIDMSNYSIEMLWHDKAYIAFGDTERNKKLAEIYDKRIIELLKSGELEKLFNKWDIYPFKPEAWKLEN